ncbi:hypothetical protein Gpo141_00012476 [Globisporangium polare]
MRRYVDAERFVLVYVGRSHSENEAAGFSCSCVGYLASSNVSALAQPGSPPVSVQQSCMHISPTCAPGDNARVQRLLRVVMDAFEDDVRFIKQQTDGLLLQQARASCSRLGAVKRLIDLGEPRASPSQ